MNKSTNFGTHFMKILSFIDDSGYKFKYISKPYSIFLVYLMPLSNFLMHFSSISDPFPTKNSCKISLELPKRKIFTAIPLFQPFFHNDFPVRWVYRDHKTPVNVGLGDFDLRVTHY